MAFAKAEDPDDLTKELNVNGTIAKDRKPVESDYFEQEPEGDRVNKMTNPLWMIGKIKGRMKAKANVVRGLGKPENKTKYDPLVQEAMMGALTQSDYYHAVRSDLG